MAARQRKDVKTTLLCAVKFWSIDKSGKTPTLRAGVRHVVRKQGFTPAAIDRAERELIREGKIQVLRNFGVTRRGSKSIKLLDDVDCSTVKLAPWTDDGYPGAALTARRRRR
jgi:hypothetical protein